MMNFLKMIKRIKMLILAALGSLLLFAPMYGCGYGGDTIMIGSAGGQESSQHSDVLHVEAPGAGALVGEKYSPKQGDISERKALEQAEGERIAGREQEDTLIRVYVCGAVMNPGVVSLPGESRVEDALLAAGGFTEDALRQALNLADWVCDGQMLYFPAEGEDMAGDWPVYGALGGIGSWSGVKSDSEQGMG